MTWEGDWRMNSMDNRRIHSDKSAALLRCASAQAFSKEMVLMGRHCLSLSSTLAVTARIYTRSSYRIARVHAVEGSAGKDRCLNNRDTKASYSSIWEEYGQFDFSFTSARSLRRTGMM